jgi:diguanylate cyclase (GGDEF)-like protein/PAS domain S-box-containing protein
MAQRDDTIGLQVDTAVLAAQLEQLTSLERALHRDTALRPVLYTFVRGVHRLLTRYFASMRAETPSIAVFVPNSGVPSAGMTRSGDDDKATVAWLLEQRVHWLPAPESSVLTRLEQPAERSQDANDALHAYFSKHNPSQQPAQPVMQLPFVTPEGKGYLVLLASTPTPVTLPANQLPANQLPANQLPDSQLPDSQLKVLELALNGLSHALQRQPFSHLPDHHNHHDRDDRDSYDARDDRHHDIEAIPDCYLGIDQLGRIQRLNQQAADMLGQPSADLRGRFLGDLLPHFRNALEVTLARATSSDQVHRLEVRAPHDGSWHELYIRATRQGFQLYSRDVSERKAIEDALKRERAEQRQLAEFRSKLIDFINHSLQIAPQDNWYQQFLEKVLNVIPGAQAGSLVVRNQLEPQARFHYVAAVGYSLKGLQALNFSETDIYARAPGQPTIIRAWQTQFPTVFTHQRDILAQATGDHALADKLERIAATLCVPVYAGAPLEPQQPDPAEPSDDISNRQDSNQADNQADDQADNQAAKTANRSLVAMLFIDNYQDGDVFDDTVLELAHAVASQMGVLIQRFELERAVRRSEQRYRYITDVIAEIVYVYRRTEDGSFVREWGNWENEQRLTGYTQAEIDALGGWSGIVHPDDVNIHFLQKTRVRRGESGVTEYRIITKSGEERWIRDFCKVLLDENGTVVAQYGANQDITEQKRFEQEREALLALNKKQRQVAEAQLAELKELHAANNRVTAVLRNNEARYKKIAEENTHLLAIEKAQRRDLEARLHELAALNHLNRVVATATDLDSTLETVTEQVAQLFQATSCGIALLRDDKGVLEVVAEHASNPNLVSSLGAHISVSDNTVNYNAVYQGQAAIVQHAQTNPGHVQAQALMRERDTHALMIAPLRSRDKVFGTIGVDSNDPERIFREQELRLLETVAGNVAGLITNARLYSLQREQFETLKTLKGQLERKNRELVYLSMRDALTGLYNRRHFDQVLVKAFATSRRYPDQPLSVVICDIDNFKKINDTFSHAVGDDVLRTVATLMLRSVRNVDTVARYGGEEFAFILPQTSLESAQHVCERIRKDIADYPWQQVHTGMTVTLSMGICADTSVGSHEKMLNMADHHLYRAKHSGKNRVCF